MNLLGIGISVARNLATISGTVATQWNAATSDPGFAISGASNQIATWSSGATTSLARATNSHSGTGDWIWSVVPSGGTANHFIGLANASASTSAFLGSDTNGIGILFSDGNVYRNGATVATPGISWVTGDTVTIELKNNFLYIRKTHSGTTSNILGDATAQTGGVDVSAMGALFPAFSVNNNLTMTADFSSWA